MSTYSLATINGATLPVADDLGSSGFITAGSVVLVGRDSAEVRETVQNPAVNGNPPLTAIQLGYFSVERTGNRLLFKPHQLSMPVDTGFVSATNLVVHHIVELNGSASVEERIYVPQ